MLRGYSLIELMVVIVLIGLVFTAGYMGLHGLSERTLSEREEADRTRARLQLLSRLKKDLFEADRAFASPSSSTLRLVDGEQVLRYEFGDEVVRKVAGEEGISFQADMELLEARFQGREQAGSERPFDRLEVEMRPKEGKPLRFTLRKEHGAKALMELEEH